MNEKKYDQTLSELKTLLKDVPALRGLPPDAIIPFLLQLNLKSIGNLADWAKWGLNKKKKLYAVFKPTDVKECIDELSVREVLES